MSAYDIRMNGDRATGQERVTVSLSPGRLQLVKARVARGEAASVSAYVDRVLEEAEQSLTLEEVLADMDREYGPPSEEAKAWAREVLGL